MFTRLCRRLRGRRKAAAHRDPDQAPPWWEEQERLWNELVPASGQAHTVQGELIRATGKAADEAYRNGNVNWESGYDALVAAVGENLTAHGVFSPQENAEIERCVREIIDNFEAPDLSGHGSAYYRLSEMAVRFCRARREPIPREPDPDLRI